jgi:hypothetical protein
MSAQRKTTHLSSSPVLLSGKYKIASACKVVPTARAILKPLNFRAFNPQIIQSLSAQFQSLSRMQLGSLSLFTQKQKAAKRG